jgi:hypothetical protein
MGADFTLLTASMFADMNIVTDAGLRAAGEIEHQAIGRDNLATAVARIGVQSTATI